ncbi:hypothetical protein GG496_001496 [Candidatus Fervidibacteria bacterium JGI MDM2 JNZ-1-D12]
MTALERIEKIEQEVANRLEIPRECARAIFYMNEDLQPTVIVQIFLPNGYATAESLVSANDEEIVEHLVRRLREDYSEAISVIQKILGR